ncbi:hypothetical protein BT96DRAFT_341679 [Gymnopus androsaceus JB14]|uniref:Uncharacterized protein n=1 Tax=Gymnopus androsaceus JB14 TaxID=1447944 RepID=A0A6A4GXV0_9AGAR|nr:hypothetical protein BT96DRAFT_341679 [Gymnopus androsaceus JB14]
MDFWGVHFANKAATSSLQPSTLPFPVSAFPLPLLTFLRNSRQQVPFRLILGRGMLDIISSRSHLGWLVRDIISEMQKKNMLPPSSMNF